MAASSGLKLSLGRAARWCFRCTVLENVIVWSLTRSSLPWDKVGPQWWWVPALLVSWLALSIVGVPIMVAGEFLLVRDRATERRSLGIDLLLFCAWIAFLAGVLYSSPPVFL